MNKWKWLLYQTGVFKTAVFHECAQNAIICLGSENYQSFITIVISVIDLFIFNPELPTSNLCLSVNRLKIKLCYQGKVLECWSNWICVPRMLMDCKNYLGHKTASPTQVHLRKIQCKKMNLFESRIVLFFILFMADPCVKKEGKLYLMC